MFRILEKDNLSHRDQFKLLSRLFPSDSLNSLKDNISHYIVSTYISSKFYKDFNQTENESLKLYNKRV